jgi:GAF domain-containing protein
VIGLSDVKLSESRRIERLRQIGILDTAPDKLFSDLAEQALVYAPGMSIAAISLVDSNRQWFKSIIGLNVTEMPRDVSFCSHTIQTSGVMVVQDATNDSRFADNPLVTSFPRIRSYAGVKLMDSVGALCVIGLAPHCPNQSELDNLVQLAQCIDIQLLAHGTLYNLRRN